MTVSKWEQHEAEKTEALPTDVWEAYEWMEETFMALHLDSTS